MSSNGITIFVVDDDSQVRDSIGALVESMGLPSRGFASAEAFLDSMDSEQAGCLVTDVRLGGISGLELMELLAEREFVLPVVVLTAFAQTSLAVKAMQNGAVTVLDKPCEDNELWEAIRQGLTTDRKRRAQRAERAKYRNRWERLNDSERIVLEQVLAGKPNKSIARLMSVSTRTIENRRRSVYSKMEVETLAELVRAVLKAGVE